MVNMEEPNIHLILSQYEFYLFFELYSKCCIGLAKSLVTIAIHVHEKNADLIDFITFGTPPKTNMEPQ